MHRSSHLFALAILLSFSAGSIIPRKGKSCGPLTMSQNKQNGNLTSTEMSCLEDADSESQLLDFISKNKFTGDKSSWKGRSFVSVKQLEVSGIELCLKTAERMKSIVKRKGGCEKMKKKTLGCMFYEPSTRTSSSFQAAMSKLGGSNIYLSKESSSAQKGENLGDSVRCLSAFCDAVALRHPEEGSSLEAAVRCPKPIINAGDGPGEHPTQALLDLFTIRCELGSIEGKVITLVGDLRFGRTVHSLVRLLKFFDGVQLHYVSPENLRMPSIVKEELSAAGVQQTEHLDYQDILPKTDVLYMTRVQKERFHDREEYESCKHVYVLTPDQLSQAKSNMIIMHPLPRVGEISEIVDGDPRSAYFRQIEYGMYMRMAILTLLLGDC